MTDTQKPSIFGRERALIEGLTKRLHSEAKERGDYTEPTETSRGYTFEVVSVAAGDPTGRVARVTIELDRVDMTAHPGTQRPA